MPSKLEQLRQFTDVVADTGDIEAIRRFKPVDATTNPTLLFKAAQLPHYKSLVSDIVAAQLKSSATSGEQMAACCDELAVTIGSEISQLIPGRISTEVDARLSFDTEATVQRAQQLVERYAQRGVPASRILIKIASTWEGIRAAERLEKSGINCNLTLLFGFAQAQACADAGATLISPFVGRILDWHKAHGETPASSAEDPGVRSVQRIYGYYKQHGYQTVVMGASFRNTGQIEELAGCDRLTISPALLESLAGDEGELARRLSPDADMSADEKTVLDEGGFRWSLNEDAMATEKLAEGIRSFTSDQLQLEALLKNWR